MFPPSDQPRIFACPPGADFPQVLVDGLRHRLSGQPPEKLARVELYVNTRRMQRRIRALFDAGPACIQPKVRIVTDLTNDPLDQTKPAVSALRRRLELSQLVARLLDKEPDLAPRSTIFDLADSLALLLDEMHDEGVTPDAITGLDVTDRSGHWQRSQSFLNIVARYFGDQNTEAPSATARQRLVTEQLVDRWSTQPPDHPIIVAGSTGSRGGTAMLMHAVARLPQGAIILPGFDFELPVQVWQQLNDAMLSEDHPQYRFARLIEALDTSPDLVAAWSGQVSKPVVARNRLLSLALRPAPFTSQWMLEGPGLTRVDLATKDMALIDAPTDRSEAVAIALALRKAADTGKTAALVTPDRLLTRRVKAALDTWKIEPDVSVGEPLALSAPGRFLRHVSELFGRVMTSDSLLILLKHPLTNSGGKDRGAHLLFTRELEMKFRRAGPPYPTGQDILDWAGAGDDSADRLVWAHWVVANAFIHAEGSEKQLSAHLDLHIKTAQTLADGPAPVGTGALWEKTSGQEAQKTVADLRRNAEYGGPMSAADYITLFRSVLDRGEVRDPVRPHPNIMIWGTLEARVQGADLVILGGLNDGVWPELPSPDPWLNRDMRFKAGLLLPERRIGLSAHDFQQAIAAKQVILSRSVRNAEAETVPSRWLNRLTNLMGGMSETGKIALAEMRGRGQVWVDLARQMDAPQTIVDAEPRPCPRPPLAARPRSLSVTAVSKLIRDPYAIYASNVLRLKKLDPLHRQPDAPMRGTVLHQVMEQFIRDTDWSQGMAAARSSLLKTADEVLRQHAPWPAARALWRAKLERVATVFLQDEQLRRTLAKPHAFEVWGALHFADLDFTLKGKADRIDRTAAGAYIIYDYKTGTVPTKVQLRHFDKQLLLEALMAEKGAFDHLPANTVVEVAHIGIGATPKYDPVRLEPGEIRKVRAEFLELIASYQQFDQGYASRRAVAQMRFGGDYDHLARFGEWDDTQKPVPTEVDN